MRHIDLELAKGPFTVAQARQQGFRWHDLQTKAWRRLSYGQYASSRLPLDIDLKLRAVDARMPAGYAFSGRTAAWIFGLDMAPSEPVEVTVPRDAAVHARVGMRLRRAALPDGDVVMRRGFRVTSELRTIRELGSSKDVVESVVALDTAFHAGLVELRAVRQYVDTHPGEKCIARLRRAIGLANAAAESPMETRLRIRLVKARLPPPCVQAELHDAAGTFIARADLYYPDRRLVVEYDGENHKQRLAADLRRQNSLIAAGYRVLRFTASDIRTPGLVENQVRQARALLPKYPT